ncbi:MAG TPA: hypothetical protein VFJ16_03290 [Longimicrobium sp.]|nr:hypothetical protein [Longimicrobium sp.]
MEADSLATLGLQLRAEADEWLGELLGPWHLPGAEAAAEPLAELALLESAVARLAGQVAELERLESSLTAGFPGAPVPAVLADDAAALDEPGADPRPVRRGRDGGAPPMSPAPSSASQDRQPVQDAAGARADRPRIASVSSGSGDGVRRDDVGSLAPEPMTRRRLDVPFSAPADDRGAADRRSGAPDTASPRAAREWDAPPSSGGGIGGLGDLAMLAGSGGLDVPPDAEQPNDGASWDQPRFAGDVERAGGASAWDDPASPRRETAWGDAPRPSPSAPSDAVTREGPTSGRIDSPSMDAAARPIRLRAWDGRATDESWSGGSAAEPDRSSSPEGASGDQERDGGAARAERRWTDLPASIARLAADAGLAFGVPESVALPFLSMPGEPEAGAIGEGLAERNEAGRSGGSVAIDRRPRGFPAPRSGSAATSAAWPGTTDAADRGRAEFDGAVANTGGMASLAALGELAEEIGRAASVAGFDGLAADAEGVAAREVARAVGRRVRTAAEILGALGETALTVDSAPRLQGSTEWPTLAPEPVERPAAEPGAAPDPQPRAVADEPPVAIVRSVEAAPRDAFPEPLSLADVDVQDLMDALAREIMHEYRRHYGA